MRQEIKIKNKNNWGGKILDVLKNKTKGLTISEIAEELKCSDFPIRRLFKILEKEKKIVLSGKNPVVAQLTIF